MSWSHEIDLSDPELTGRDVTTLHDLMRLNMRYIREGRIREAHGVEMALTIVWHRAKWPRNQGALPAFDSKMADL